jgi:hypothetical protein
MSGVNRNIMADLRDADSVEEVQAAFSPEAIRAETGTAAEDKKEAD